MVAKVLLAIHPGWMTPEVLAEVTPLSKAQVIGALRQLKRKGVVNHHTPINQYQIKITKVEL